jgi:S1-C subfamily serine protease
VLTEPQVSEESAAEKFGIRNGDVIESLNGKCIPTVVEVGCTADVLCSFK